MDAVMFLKERARMCNSFNLCPECPIGSKLNCSCSSDQYADCEEEAVSLVEKWSYEHPQKTMLQDFLEKFPYAILDEDNKIPIFCPFNFGYEKEDSKTCAKYTCVECWNRPLEG